MAGAGRTSRDPPLSRSEKRCAHPTATAPPGMPPPRGGGGGPPEPRPAPEPIRKPLRSPDGHRAAGNAAAHAWSRYVLGEDRLDILRIPRNAHLWDIQPRDLDFAGHALGRDEAE